MIKAAQYTVKGIVQGVGFRYFTINEAKRLGIRGYVKNLFNGNVEVYAVGSQEQLDKLEKKLKQGPQYAKVDYIDKEERQVNKNFADFHVVY